MEVVKELALLIEWFGDKEGFKIDIDAFDLSIPVRALVPNSQLDDDSTAFKLVWRDGKIEEVLFDPEDGILHSQNLLSSIKEKCERKKTIGSVVKIVFGEICGENVTPVPSNPHTPDYLLRAKKTATPDSHGSSSSGSGIPIYYTRFEEEYQFLEDLGEGSSGWVAKVLHKLTGMEHALKMVRPREGNEEILLNEVKALSRLQHANIVRYYDAWTQHMVCHSGLQPSKPKVERILFVSMEFCPSTLAKELEKRRNENSEFSTEKLENIFRDIAKGLAHIHKKGFVHRDLSLHNTFMDKEGITKIGDFGSVEIKTEGSPVNDKIDMYAFGVIMYELMNPLLEEVERTRAVDRAKLGIIPTDLMSTPLGRAVASLLHENPKKRPCAASLFVPDSVLTTLGRRELTSAPFGSAFQSVLTDNLNFQAYFCKS